jgi:hypothetical protein
MKHADFKIGKVFYTDQGPWVCTDIGTRVIIAVEKKYADKWPNGPPYEVMELVFDEYDFEVCTPELPN